MVGFGVAWFVETVMRRITILAAAAMICAGACDTLAHFHSNCHTAPYGSCNSAHFDDHQLHDDLQFAGRQLSNSLSYPRPVGVWNHDIERYGKYSVFVKLL
jgi:hypothetical protein